MSGAIKLGGYQGGDRGREQTWGKNALVTLQGGSSSRLIDVWTDAAGAPAVWALALSANLIGGGQPAALYNVRLGIGDDWYEWRNLPAPAAGAVYVVQGHNVQVDLVPNAGGAISVAGWATPSDLIPTLTP